MGERSSTVHGIPPRVQYVGELHTELVLEGCNVLVEPAEGAVDVSCCAKNYIKLHWAGTA